MKEIKTIKELEEELDEINKRRFEIDKIIDDIELNEELPSLKEKYEGKYFKFKSDYGSDSDEWYVYSHCKEVNKLNSFTCDTFEIKPHGEHEFNYNSEEYAFLLQTEITPEEYYGFLDAFIDILNKLKK